MKKTIIILCSFFTYFYAHSQISTDLRPDIKSPEVNKFEQYINMPVNMVSGTPQISIPIYTLQYKGMSLPITLDYDASGVKVGAISSSVGLNWSLNVGGTVSRIVKGAPDEGNPYSYASSIIDIDGYYQDYGLSKLDSILNTLSAGDPNNGNSVHERSEQFNTWLNDVAMGFKDSQPDLFYFSTPLGGAKFVFNDNREIVYTENTDFIVSENFSTNQFQYWEAISPTGIKFKFGNNGNNESSYTAGIGEITNQFKVNSWFLTEILNQANNQKIDITYIDNGYSTVTNNNAFKISDPCRTSIYNPVIVGSCGNGVGIYSSFAHDPYDTGQSPWPQLGNGQYLENRLKSKLISKIIAGNILIDFVYENRIDLLAELANTPKRLQRIEVSYNGTCIKQFIFEYSYSTSSDYSPGFSGDRHESLRKRLMLDGFKEINCDETLDKNYSFVYNSQTLPHRTSYAQDKWGYYNGVITNQSLFPNYLNSSFDNPADRSVNYTTTKAQILEKIVYPTGGSVEFEYESHQSDEPTNYIIDNWPSTANFTINSQSSSDNDPIVSTNFTYDPTKFYKIDIELLSPPLNNPCGAGTAFTITSVNNTSGNPDFSYFYQDLFDSSCFNQNPYCSVSSEIMLDDSFFQDGLDYVMAVYGYNEGFGGTCLAATAKLYETSKIPTYEIGGLRVKKITHKDSDNSVAKEMSYTYSNSNVIYNPSPVHRAEYNYNFIYDNLNGIVSSSNINYLKQVFHSFDLLDGIWDNEGYFYSLSPGHDPLTIDFMGPNIVYQYVVESNGNSSSTYTFLPYKSYFELNGYQTLKQYPPNSIAQTIMAGEKIAVNQLGTVSNNLVQLIHNTSRTNTSVIGLNVSSNLGSTTMKPFDKYYIEGQTKTLHIQSSIEDYGSQVISNSTEYFYEGNNHNQATRIVSINSKGEQTTIKNYYPSDNEVINNPYMSNLVGQNRIATPVLSENYLNEDDTSLGTLMNKQETEFDNSTSSTNLVLLKNLKTQKGEDSLNLEKRVIYEKYDDSGNPTQYKNSDDISTCIIWGYNEQYPVAKVENATYSEIEALNNFGSGFTLGDGGLSTSQISDLLLLTNAMVTTYTYDPLIGVTSITDPKGYTTYYQYDDFGRLEFVKDHNGNILSNTNYKYKQ